jgi:hypothetical protein
MTQLTTQTKIREIRDAFADVTSDLIKAGDSAKAVIAMDALKVLERIPEIMAKLHDKLIPE